MKLSSVTTCKPGGQAKSFRPKPHTAFTLLEVLVAVSIFAVVLLAIHSVFYGALRLHNKTVAALEESVPLQHALAILKRDLANIVPPGGTLFGQFQSIPTFGTVTNSSSGSLSAGGWAAFNATSLKGRIVSPTFHTAVGILSDQAPWAQVQRVVYYLAEPTNAAPGKDLIRSVTRNLLAPLDEQPEDQWLLGGVEDVVFWFFDGTSWWETWDSTQQPAKLPQAIKVELYLASAPAQQVARAPITLVVPIQLQPGTNQTSTLTAAR
jgi:general secretion pathway protein J